MLVFHYEGSAGFKDDQRRHNTSLWKDDTQSKAISFSRMEWGDDVLHLPSPELERVHPSREDEQAATGM